MLLVGFTILIKSADLLVTGASSVARRLKVSELAIGLTVVAFGTSTPELFVNLVASFQGNTAIAIGNILGSNVANILLILGISSIIYPLSVTKGTVWKEIPFSLLAAVVMGILANDILIDAAPTAILKHSDGLIFLSFFIIFLFYTVNIATEIQGVQEHIPTKKYGLLRSLVFIILGLFGLILGGKWIVAGALTIATHLGVSQSLVGLTIVAVGTSLPELATSAMAAYKRNVEIAVGNVVGSNIFNILFILGISALIKPLPFQPARNLDIVVVVLSSLLLFGFMFTGKKRSLDRREGIVFVFLYGVYVAVIAILQ
ncbi:MAG: calcium/sodium antiporter [Desulfobacterales bacterium]